MKHIFFLFLFLFSCSNHTIIPKPKAFFYNELSVPSYVNYITDCGYSFFINSNNEIDLENCNMKIKNSSLNSTLYLSKINIQNNFNLIDSDFSKKINQILTLCVLGIIWGSSFILMKKALTTYSPIEITLYRIFIVFLVFFPLGIKSFFKIKMVGLSFCRFLYSVFALLCHGCLFN